MGEEILLRCVQFEESVNFKEAVRLGQNSMSVNDVSLTQVRRFH